MPSITFASGNQVVVGGEVEASSDPLLKIGTPSAYTDDQGGVHYEEAGIVSGDTFFGIEEGSFVYRTGITVTNNTVTGGEYGQMEVGTLVVHGTEVTNDLAVTGNLEVDGTITYTGSWYDTDLSNATNLKNTGSHYVRHTLVAGSTVHMQFRVEPSVNGTPVTIEPPYTISAPTNTLLGCAFHGTSPVISIVNDTGLIEVNTDSGEGLLPMTGSLTFETNGNAYFNPNNVMTWIRFEASDNGLANDENANEPGIWESGSLELRDSSNQNIITTSGGPFNPPFLAQYNGNDIQLWTSGAAASNELYYYFFAGSGELMDMEPLSDPIYVGIRGQPTIVSHQFNDSPNEDETPSSIVVSTLSTTYSTNTDPATLTDTWTQRVSYNAENVTYPVTWS